jgi:hypothetical protein
MVSLNLNLDIQPKTFGNQGLLNMLWLIPNLKGFYFFMT